MKTSGQKCWWVQPVASECTISAGVNEHHVLCGYRFLHPSFILFSPCAKQFSPGDARLAKGCCGNSHKFLIVQISESHASSSVSPQRLHLIQSHISAKPLHPSSTNPDIYEQESGQELHPAILEDLKMYSSYSKWKKRVECVCVCVCVSEKGRKRKKERVIKWKRRFLHCSGCGSNQTDVSPQGLSVNTIMLSSFILTLVWKMPDWQACDGEC